MDILYAASNRLCKALADNYEAKKEAVAQLESLEREHSDTLRRLNNKISDLRQDVSERSSWSKHSSRGCRSFKSEKSSITSSLSKRADMAANVARLKTQLEFADAEAWKTTTLKCEDELKRFRLSKELAVAKAEMEAVNVADERKIEKDNREEDQFLPQETDRNYVLQNYLKTRDQMSSVTDASLPTVETYVESVLDRESPETRRTLIKEELWTSPFKVRSTEDTNSRPVLRPDSSPNPFAPPKSTALRSSLNPLVAEFETSPYRVPRTRVDAKIPVSDTAKTGITADNPRASLPLNSSSVEDSLHRLADVLCQRRLQDMLPLPEPEIFGRDLLTIPCG